MTRTLITIAVAGTVFASISATSQAAPTAPQGLSGQSTVTLVSARHGHKRSGFRHGGPFSRLGGLKSLMAMMMAGGQGGGFASMLGNFGGSGGGFQEMLSGMGDSGGVASMMSAMGGSGGIASMMSGMGGSGGMAAMMSAMGGGGGGMAALAGGGGGGGGGAQYSQAARQACTPDALRLCSDAIPNIDKVKACMQAKSAQLSAPCRAAMNAEATPRPRVASLNENQGGSAGYERSGGFNNGQNYGGGNFGGQGFGHFENGPGYDTGGAVERYDYSGGNGGFGDFGGQGGFNAAQLIGMARRFGFGSFDNWRN